MSTTDRGQSKFGLDRLGALLAVSMCLFHLFASCPFTEPIRAEIFYPLHLTFILLILFIDDAANAFKRCQYLQLFLNLILIITTILAIGYLMLKADYIANRFTYAQPLTRTEIVFGVGIMIVVLEACRRTIGSVLCILVLIFILYARFGNLLPEPFWHQGFTSERIVEMTYMTVDGLWNIPIRAAANFIFLFILLGTFLLESGAGTFFTDLACALTGRTVGGPAKVAVVSSAFMGMLSGSAAGNVVTTGSFTIPAMKKVGYKPEFAAGVEAVASTGGQLTPPIMGAAAFLMSEFTGIPYGRIIVLAIIPALMYYIAVFTMVDLEARRISLRPNEDNELPSAVQILLNRGYLLLPVLVLCYFLYKGYTPMAAGFWAIIAIFFLVIVFDPLSRRSIHKVLFKAFNSAPHIMCSVSVACAMGGILAGIIVLTGLGVKISGIILEVSGNVVFIALFLSMIVAILLGMGMPTSAAYIILAALLASGLVKMGIPVASAHFFIIYCAAMSGITPPVALSSFAAAGIAGTDPWRTSFVAIKLGLSVYIIPYMFVYGPALLGIGSIFEVITTFLTAVFGVVLLSIAGIGWFKIPLKFYERSIAFAAAISMIYSGLLTDSIGFGLAGLLAGLIFLRYKTAPKTK